MARFRPGLEGSGGIEARIGRRDARSHGPGHAPAGMPAAHRCPWETAALPSALFRHARTCSGHPCGSPGPRRPLSTGRGSIWRPRGAVPRQPACADSTGFSATSPPTPFYRRATKGSRARNSARDARVRGPERAGRGRYERSTSVVSLTPGRDSRAAVRGPAIEDDQRRSKPTAELRDSLMSACLDARPRSGRLPPAATESQEWAT